MKTPSQIKIGIYGRPQAGKTRFLYEVIRYWETHDRLLSRSPSSNTFLGRIKSQVESHGETSPTEPTTIPEDITVDVVYEDAASPPSFTFRDYTGEQLEGGIDNLESSPTNRAIHQQVNDCDAFLFLFDPTNWEDPSGRDAHHRREMRRVSDFIEYVLKNRENEHLPVIFVATREDTWRDDPDIQRITNSWMEKANEKVRTLYKKELKHHFPPALVDHDETCLRTAVDRPETFDAVIGKIRSLHVQCRKFQSADRMRARTILGIAATVVLCLFVGGYYFAIAESTPPSSSPRSDSGQSISARLDQINNDLKRYPSNAALVSEENAKGLNSHLNWLMTSMDQREPAEGIEANRDRISKAVDDVTHLMNNFAAADNVNTSKKLDILGLLLANIVDATTLSPTLTTAQVESLASTQKRYWDIYRQQVVENLADIMSKHGSSQSSPRECLKELIEILKTKEIEIGQPSVAIGNSTKADLSRFIGDGRRFCEELEKKNEYTLNVNVKQASLTTSSSEGPSTIDLVLTSKGNSESDSILLTPRSEGNGRFTFTTRFRSFPLAIQLGQVQCRLSKFDAIGERWHRITQEALTPPASPYLAIGMPLQPSDGASQTFEIKQDGYIITLVFFKFPDMPNILKETVQHLESGGRE